MNGNEDKDYSGVAASNMKMAATMVGLCITVLALLVSLSTSEHHSRSEMELLTAISLVSIFLFCLSVLFYNVGATIGKDTKEFRSAIQRGNDLFLLGLLTFLGETVFLLWLLDFYIATGVGIILLASFLIFVIYKRRK